jgi:hypothetical protein
MGVFLDAVTFMRIDHEFGFDSRVHQARVEFPRLTEWDTLVQLVCSRRSNPHKRQVKRVNS